MTVCALPLPAGTKAATIAGIPVALPRAEAKRIILLGDTGCRLKGTYVQSCNDPQEWPFRLIADVIAQQKPDLIIHVGDYHYRESACPAGNLGCAGTPFGDNWDVWREDFFAPADTLLRTVPWVFVRGNHEDCERGGKGWSRTLEPTAFAAETGCNGIAKPFVADVGGLSLVVMDVGLSREERVDAKQVALFREHYGELARLNGPAWLLQHKPIWSAGGVIGGKPIGDNKTLAAAMEGRLYEQVQLMISGHHHIFQVLNYQASIPAQIVSGHGGDYLNESPPLDPAGWTFGNVTVKSGLNVFGSFGFSIMDRREADWRLTNYDRFGKLLHDCAVKGRTAECAK